MIGLLGPSPQEDHITAWLAHLTDDEVLERVSRLRYTYEPDTMLSNAEVLVGLRDEALSFGHDDRG